MTKIFLYFLFLFLSVAPCLASTVYHIDPTNTADGSRDGTYTHPYISWTELPTRVTGDDVYFKCGTTFSPSAYLNINWEGTSGDPAIIGSYYMDGGSPVYGVSGARPIISGSDWTVPSNLDFGSSDSWVGLISVFSKDYVQIKNLHVYRSGYYGIYISGSHTSSTNSYGYLVDNCFVEYAYWTGISSNKNDSSYGTISNCEVSHCSYTKVVDPGQSGGPASLTITNSQTPYDTISTNYVHHGWMEGIGVYNVDSLANCGYVTIEKNTVYCCRSVGIYLGPGNYITVRRNIVMGAGTGSIGGSLYSGGWGSVSLGGRYWNGSGIGIENEPWHAIQRDITHYQVYNNLVVGYAFGFWIGSGFSNQVFTDVTLYHNTLIGNYINLYWGSYLPSFIDTGSEFKNNIFLCPSGATCSDYTTDQTTFTWDYNGWTSAPTNMAGANDVIVSASDVVGGISWQAITEEDISSVQAAAYIIEGGNADGAGVTVTEPTTDILEEDFASPPSIGFYEVGSASETIISGGSPSGTVTCAASVVLGANTDKAATLKFDTVDTTYALMSNTFGTTGGTVHSHIFSVSCNQSYTLYVRAADSTSSYIITFSTGPNNNLLSASAYIAGSDSNTYDPCYAIENLWDGDTSVGSCGTSTGGTFAQIDHARDLGASYDITAANLWGDATNTWQCGDWAFYYKANVGDSWTQVFTGQDCTANDWDNHSISVTGRYVRFVINEETTGNGVQAAELSVTGSLTSTPPAATSGRPRATRPLGVTIGRATAP